MDSPYPPIDYGVEKVLHERLVKLFEGLDPVQARAQFEGMIDDYTASVFGVSLLEHARKVQLASGGRSVTFQPLADGRAILTSAYGFRVKSQSQCKCGRAFLVLDEMNQEDSEKDRYDGL